MKQNKITTGLDKLDEILGNGIKAGELSIIMGQPNYCKTSFFYNEQLTKKITEAGQKNIREIQDYLKNNNIKFCDTNLEIIGDEIFPITYFPNGIVICDYPNNLLNGKK